MGIEMSTTAMHKAKAHAKANSISFDEAIDDMVITYSKNIKGNINKRKIINNLNGEVNLLAEENLDLKSKNHRMAEMLEKVVIGYSYMFGMRSEIKEIQDLLKEVKNEKVK